MSTELIAFGRILRIFEPVFGRIEADFSDKTPQFLSIKCSRSIRFAELAPLQRYFVGSGASKESFLGVLSQRSIRYRSGDQGIDFFPLEFSGCFFEFFFFQRGIPNLCTASNYKRNRSTASKIIQVFRVYI